MKECKRVVVELLVLTWSLGKFCTYFLKHDHELMGLLISNELYDSGT
jgi:hypothetical protein